MDPGADPYVQPNGTLRNKLGLTDPVEFARVADQLVTFRQAILARRGLPLPFTVQTLRDVHHHLFQDVFDWAGNFRTCHLKKTFFEDSDRFSEFAPFPALETRCAALMSDLRDRSFLAGLDRAAFCRFAAEAFARLNTLHPFREGNGRVQRLLFLMLARNIGRDLAFDVITHERMVDVSIRSHHGNVPSMVRLFDEITDPDRVRPLRRLIGFLKRENLAWNDIYIATTTAGQSYSGVLAGIDAPDFMLRVTDRERDWIAAGHVDDLPDDALPGQRINLRATRF